MDSSTLDLSCLRHKSFDSVSGAAGVMGFAIWLVETGVLDKEEGDKTEWIRDMIGVTQAFCKECDWEWIPPELFGNPAGQN